MEGNREEREEPQRNHEMNVNARDRLFHAIFLKVGLAYARTVPKPVRTGMEILLISKAIILFTVLSYIHFTFSKQPMDCLESIQNDWPRDGILRVQVLLGPDGSSSEVLKTSFSFSGNSSSSTSALDPRYIPFNKSSATHEYQPQTGKKKASASGYLQSFFDLVVDTNKAPRRDTVVDGMHFKGMEKFVRGYQNVKEHYIMEFSLEYGFLRLSPMTRQKLKIPIKVVNLDPVKDKCFGDSVSKFLLSHFLGYDDVLIASIKRLAEMEENRGFMRNVMTGEHYRFVSVWMGRSSYIIAFLLMFVFTISVATLLRFCHQQIFFFIVHLLQMLDWNVAVAFPVAPLFTVILSLVGMEVIMSEFFNDTSTSFYIILIVWAADQFDSICCHTTVSQKYWLRFFYLYHFVFYAYHYRFNGQYSSIALASSWFFIQHSMLYFLHNYELPAIESQVGRVNGAVDDTYIEDAVAFLVDGVQWPVMVEQAHEPNEANQIPEDTENDNVLAGTGLSNADSTENINGVVEEGLNSLAEIVRVGVEDTGGAIDPEVGPQGVIGGVIQETDSNSRSTSDPEDDIYHVTHRTYDFLPSNGHSLIIGQQLGYVNTCISCTDTQPNGETPFPRATVETGCDIPIDLSTEDFWERPLFGTAEGTCHTIAPSSLHSDVTSDISRR